MVKTRFSSLDVRAMVNSIRPSIVGCKLTNIYDINSKVYLLKLARSGFKCFLLLESGMRFHLTGYTRDKSVIPSNYTMKLRKHLRTRRLTAVEQIGVDRCVDFTFGHGENSFHLILELYVSGNLILTDHEYKILALLRAHSGGEQQSKVAMRQIYPLDAATGLLKCPIPEFGVAVEAALELASQRQDNQEIMEIQQEDEKAKQNKKLESAFARRSKKRVKHDAMPMVQLLHRLAPFADPALCAACIKRQMEADGRPCEKPFHLTVEDLPLDEVVPLLQRAAERVLETLRSVSRPCDLGGGNLAPLLTAAHADEHQEDADEDEDDLQEPLARQDAEMAQACGDGAEGDAPIIPGWILRKRVHVPPSEPHWAHDEFTPLQPDPRDEPEALVPYATFHHCVDEFFTQLEEHKAVEQKAQHAQSVYAKVERIRADQGRRVEQLEAEQEVSERQAHFIEANVELVDRALAMLNVMIASQVDWGELKREVRRQQRLGHPIAQHIHSLDLERNEVRLLLGPRDEEEGSDDGEGGQREAGQDDTPMEVVTLDLNRSSHANVARLHSRRKETREKTSRTLTHAESAVKQAERKAQQDLQKFQLKQTLRRVRMNWWFEKFIWFISSENYLVIAGHDPSQAEQILCKHVGLQDVFVQADVAGALSCFVRNPEGGEVPPATLREAGTLALCHSTAWDKHMVISAWWAPVAQVSRGAPPAENDFVVIDSFFVSGRRHFLPPLHLEMGFTLLFHVGDASAARHKGERRSRYLEAMGGAAGADGGRGAAGVESDDACSEDHDDEEAPAAQDGGGSGPDGGEAEAQPGATARPEEGAREAGAAEIDAGSEGDASEESSAEAADAACPAEERSAPEEQAASGGGDSPSNERGGARSRVSRAERRRLKKGGGGGGCAGEDGDDAPPSAAADEAGGHDFHPPRRSADATEPKAMPAKAAAARAAPAQPLPAKASSAQAPLPRGQRAKAKKMKEKYAEQDEEERELRLALLGSKATKRTPGGAEGCGVAAADGHAAEAPPPAAADAPESGLLPAGAGAPEGNPTPATQGGKDGGGGRGKGAGKQARRQPTERVLTPGCDAENGGAGDLQLALLDSLTGQPQQDDEALYALPMVAPYCALGGPYTLRVKLTPGPTKKGQVVKQCLKMLEAQVERPAWRQLVQAIPEQEAASLMCGTCKLSMPGMQKLQQKVKQDKKKEMKERERAAAVK